MMGQINDNIQHVRQAAARPIAIAFGSIFLLLVMISLSMLSRERAMRQRVVELEQALHSAHSDKPATQETSQLPVIDGQPQDESPPTNEPDTAIVDASPPPKLDDPQMDRLPDLLTDLLSLEKQTIQLVKIPVARELLKQLEVYRLHPAITAEHAVAASRLAYRIKAVDQSLEWAEHSIEKSLASIYDIAQLSEQMMMEGNTEPAQQLLRACQKLAPNHVGVRRSFVRLAYVQGNIGEAIRLADELYKTNQANPSTLEILGLALLDLGKPIEAIEPLYKWAQMDRGNGKAHRTVGLALLQARRFGDAAASLRTAIRLNELSIDSWFLSGVAHANLGDCAYAVTCFSKVLGIRADHADALLARAICHARNGEAEQAVKDRDAALALNPTLRDEARAANVLAEAERIFNAQQRKKKK